MTRVCARPAPGRGVDVGDFADITAVPVVEILWTDGNVLCIDFEGVLTPEQARRVAIRCQSTSPAEEEARVELDRLCADIASVADDPLATERERDFTAMLTLVTSLLTPGPVMTEAGDAAGN